MTTPRKKTATAIPELSPELVVHAYCMGCFPMARSRRARTVEWFSPDPRAILPLESFHVPHGLRRRLKKPGMTITRDRDFPAVIRACGQDRPVRKETWINPAIVEVYTRMHRMGLAHSVEAWLPDEAGTLVGGLYGVALGAAFFGESMFSTADDASKLCLVHLVEHLRARGFTLLDVQMTSPHMARFGVVEVPREDYLGLLTAAISRQADW